MSLPKFHRTITVLDSEWIDRIEYDPDSLTLDVTTKATETIRAKRYRYQSVGTDTFAKLITAPSVGAYFNAAIKGQYRSKKLRAQ